MKPARVEKWMAAALALSLAAGCATVPPHPRTIALDAAPGAGADAAFAAEALSYAKSTLSDNGWRLVDGRDEAANVAAITLSCTEDAALGEWRVCSSSVDIALSELRDEEWVASRKRLEIQGDRGRDSAAARKSLAGKAGRAAAEWIDCKARKGE